MTNSPSPTPQPSNANPQPQPVDARLEPTVLTPSQGVAETLPPMPATSLNVQAGQSIGQYELIQKLGEGGMGQVWKARHVRLDKFVALKILPPALMVDPVLVDRFNCEMRIVAKLQHSNIVSAHDAGESNSLHFLVLDFVDGQDLVILPVVPSK